MKRFFTIAGTILFLLLASVYVLIPEKLNIASAVSYNANREGVFRFLINDTNWQKWWPGTVSKNEDGSIMLASGGYNFQVEKIMYDIIRLKTGNNKPDSVLLRIVPYKIDMIGIELSTSVNNGMNPFSRIAGYFRAREIKKVFDKIVSALEKYTGDIRNIYGGINIRNEKVQYQHLVSVKQALSHYPSTQEIYTIIEKLRNYIRVRGAKELFSPMLNIRKADSSSYIVQLGLPTDKDLPEDGDISSKWMMKNGNILAGEVAGGPGQIEAAMKQFEQYILDYQRSIIAIPFQMLISDRTKEPDSSKWVTRIYYPVV
ncbi:MAG: hypothetical protein JNN00_07035 [Chitinophagaceae bacterium]|nr:hypothetical protein [Chitinophagaceae bacterium]